MSGQPWYRRYASDFIAGTWGLSLEEKGAYSLVLDLIYANDGPIYDDAKYIAGVCSCSVRKWNLIRDKLIARGKIEVNEGMISNVRADRELVIRTETTRKLIENGAKGGNKSAQTRSIDRKINNLGLARLEHIQNQNHKNGNGFEEKEVSLDRYRDETIWLACVEAGWVPRDFGQKQMVPSSILSTALTNIRKGA